MNTMKRLTAIRMSNRRLVVLATIATITVAAATTLVLTWLGPAGPDPIDSAQAAAAAAGPDGSSPPKSEPPPRSGSPQDPSRPGTPAQPASSAQPGTPNEPETLTQADTPAASGAGGNVHENAPTENLGRLATALRLKHKSVNGVLLVPAGLNLTNAVEISILWDVLGPRPTRVTQDYNNATGNRALFLFPAGNGTARQVQSDITLAEKAADGTPVAVYAVKSTVTFQPLYDIRLGPLVIELLVDCDFFGASEVRLAWAGPDGRVTRWQADTFAGSRFTLSEFAQTFTEVSASADLTKPELLFYEDDPSSTTFFSTTPSKGTEPLLPGHDYAFDKVIVSPGDANCGLWSRYGVTYTLREYPFLD
jgi:hypothetical protein